MTTVSEDATGSNELLVEYDAAIAIASNWEA